MMSDEQPGMPDTLDAALRSVLDLIAREPVPAEIRERATRLDAALAAHRAAAGACADGSAAAADGSCAGATQADGDRG